MDYVDRDSTQDWLLPEAAKPPLLSELVRRVDYAVATARASEAAVVAVGEAALDAAKQARRAAELAERASAAMLGGSPGGLPSAAQSVRPSDSASSDGGLCGFIERADRVARRLHRLELIPVPGAAGVMR